MELDSSRYARYSVQSYDSEAAAEIIKHFDTHDTAEEYARTIDKNLGGTHEAIRMWKNF